MKMTGNLEMCSIARAINKIGDSWSLLILRDLGQGFQPVLVMIMAWGNKYCSPKGIDTQLVDGKTHRKIIPLVIDAKTKQPLEFTRLIYSGGPGASAEKNKILKERNIPVVPAK